LGSGTVIVERLYCFWRSLALGALGLTLVLAILMGSDGVKSVIKGKFDRPFAANELVYYWTSDAIDSGGVKIKKCMGQQHENLEYTFSFKVDKERIEILDVAFQSSSNEGSRSTLCEAEAREKVLQKIDDSKDHNMELVQKAEQGVYVWRGYWSPEFSGELTYPSGRVRKYE
jgi:hypothetical protein